MIKTHYVKILAKNVKQCQKIAWSCKKWDPAGAQVQLTQHPQEDLPRSFHWRWELSLAGPPPPLAVDNRPASFFSVATTVKSA